jgi:hypothetical protein
MRPAPFLTSIEASTRTTAHGKPTRKKLHLWLLEALHHARRLQAERIVEQHRYLIARPLPVDPTSDNGGKTDASQ